MASKTDDVRYPRSLRRVFWLALTAGAAFSGALLLNAGEASAQTVTVAGIGTFEVPNEIAIPPGLPGISASIPQQESAPSAAPSRADFATPGTEFTLPGIPGHFDLAGVPGFRSPAPVLPRVAPEKTTGEVAVEAARAKLGAGYANSAGPDAFDCSGLVKWSYEQAGVSVPRTSYDQLAAGTPVAEEDLRPGDLVSFYGGGHSALYAGDGKVIHASTYGTGVTESPMTSMPYAGARRFHG
ncbi:C40 family peptidase [Nocardia iowensis]|uniref:C40 family peptidase n=1 Tax=Nocardia iowensis TaxID=204891 RepID=A0ABX8RM67_NOCIO|nr:C40 family peptidase [Nocardia iowensis]QXN90673.1 C40 family peptidase [Nocardia iowensis]